MFYILKSVVNIDLRCNALLILHGPPAEMVGVRGVTGFHAGT